VEHKIGASEVGHLASDDEIFSKVPQGTCYWMNDLPVRYKFMKDNNKIVRLISIIVQLNARKAAKEKRCTQKGP
jgi:hypothetical protein